MNGAHLSRALVKQLVAGGSYFGCWREPDQSVGPAMSVPGGGPEVAGPRSKRRG
jgi:hypothetical protein